MKMLMFQSPDFVFSGDHSAFPEDAAGLPCIAALIQAESTDRENLDRVLRKAAKHVKWLANKRGLKRVVLHSFAHLGGSKAPLEDARILIERLGVRLAAGGYEVVMTPFGKSLAWRLTVFQDPLAKVFVAT